MSGREPPDPAQLKEVALWLAKASEDMAVAALVREEYPLPAAFHAQQALEKLLKALLIAAGQDIRRTHDLDALAKDANKFWPDLIPVRFPLAELNRWYLTSRYPGADDPPPSLTEIEEALRGIEALLTAIKAALNT
jgi:HEPN domain-containing protein